MALVMDRRALDHMLARFGVRCDLEGPTDVADSQGGYTRTNAVKLDDVLMVINTPGISGTEGWIAGVEVADVTHHVLLAYANGVSAKDRVVVNGSPNRQPLEVSRVVDPLEAHELLILLCREAGQQ